MALRDICLEGDAILLQVANPVDRFDDELTKLVRDMFETMYAATGRGLAAPQVGVSQRVFVVDTTWKEAEPEPMIFVNPLITAQAGDMRRGPEACLSIPGQSFDMARPAWIDVLWYDLDGVAKNERFEGVKAVCVCHELDHLNGVLISQSGRLI